MDVDSTGLGSMNEGAKDGRSRKGIPSQSAAATFTSGYPGDVIAEHGVLDADVSFIRKPFPSRV